LIKTLRGKKALPTTFLPSVKTLTKNVICVFLLVQVFFCKKKKCLVKSRGFLYYPIKILNEGCGIMITAEEMVMSLPMLLK
jgi:hypothetical protein